jgi:hypothetical protein
VRNFAYNLLFALFVAVPVVWLSQRANLPLWATAALVLASVIAAFWFLSLEFGTKKRSRHEFGHFIQGLLVLRDNGGFLDIKHRDSPFAIRVIRTAGDDSGAQVVVAVPRARWSEAKASALAATFEHHNIDFTTNDEELVEKSSLIEARVAIPYIWNGSAGAPPARAVHLVLDTFDLDPHQTFDLKTSGEPSWRWKQHRGELGNL